MDFKEQVKAVMGQVFNVDPASITDDASPDTIETWDSIHHMNLAVALEQAFGVEFTGEETLELMNLPLILHLLKEKTGKA